MTVAMVRWKTTIQGWSHSKHHIPTSILCMYRFVKVFQVAIPKSVWAYSVICKSEKPFIVFRPIFLFFAIIAYSIIAFYDQQTSANRLINTEAPSLSQFDAMPRFWGSSSKAPALEPTSSSSSPPVDDQGLSQPMTSKPVLIGADYSNMVYHIRWTGPPSPLLDPGGSGTQLLYP
jgi:hypothetical protein